MSTGSAGRSPSAWARMARGPVRISELFAAGVYAAKVESWFALADAAVTAKGAIES